MAARAAVLDWADTAAANPCVPLDHAGAFTYGGTEHNAVATPGGATFATCTKLTAQVMAIGGECGVPKAKLVRGSAGGRRVCKLQLRAGTWALPFEAPGRGETACAPVAAELLPSQVCNV